MVGASVGDLVVTGDGCGVSAIVLRKKMVDCLMPTDSSNSAHWLRNRQRLNLKHPTTLRFLTQADGAYGSNHKRSPLLQPPPSLTTPTANGAHSTLTVQIAPTQTVTVAPAPYATQFQHQQPTAATPTTVPTGMTADCHAARSLNCTHCFNNNSTRRFNTNINHCYNTYSNHCYNTNSAHSPHFLNTNSASCLITEITNISHDPSSINGECIKTDCYDTTTAPTATAPTATAPTHSAPGLTTPRHP